VNLFNWRPQSYTLRSVVDVKDTQRVCEILLVKHRVTILGQESKLVWKCLAMGLEESDAKEVNFRIEFASTIPDGSGIRNVTPRITGQYFTRVTLIQEKGALSTFKRIHTDLKNDWTLDELVTASPAVRAHVPSGPDDAQIGLQML